MMRYCIILGLLGLAVGSPLPYDPETKLPESIVSRRYCPLTQTWGVQEVINDKERIADIMSRKSEMTKQTPPSEQHTEDLFRVGEISESTPELPEFFKPDFSFRMNFKDEEPIQTNFVRGRSYFRKFNPVGLNVDGLKSTCNSVGPISRGTFSYFPQGRAVSRTTGNFKISMPKLFARHDASATADLCGLTSEPSFIIHKPRVVNEGPRLMIEEPDEPCHTEESDVIIDEHYAPEPTVTIEEPHVAAESSASANLRFGYGKNPFFVNLRSVQPCVEEELDTEPRAFEFSLPAQRVHFRQFPQGRLNHRTSGKIKFSLPKITVRNDAPKAEELLGVTGQSVFIQKPRVVFGDPRPMIKDSVVDESCHVEKPDVIIEEPHAAAESNTATNLRFEYTKNPYFGNFENARSCVDEGFDAQSRRFEFSLPAQRVHFRRFPQGQLFNRASRKIKLRMPKITLRNDAVTTEEPFGVTRRSFTIQQPPVVSEESHLLVEQPVTDEPCLAEQPGVIIEEPFDIEEPIVSIEDSLVEAESKVAENLGLQFVEKPFTFNLKSIQPCMEEDFETEAHPVEFSIPEQSISSSVEASSSSSACLTGLDDLSQDIDELGSEFHVDLTSSSSGTSKFTSEPISISFSQLCDEDDVTDAS